MATTTRCGRAAHGIVKYVLALALVGLGIVLPSRAYGQPTGLAYVPVPACTLVRTGASAPGQMGADETRGFLARGEVDLTPQGGAEEGCGIPDNAAVIAVTVRIGQAAGRGQLKLWAGDQAEPRFVRADFGATAPASLSELVELCVTPPCASDFDARTVRNGAQLRVDVVGYFAPAAEAPTGQQGAAGTKGDQETHGVPGPKAVTTNPVGGICAVSCAGTGATVSVNDSHGKCTLSFNYPCAPYSCNGSGTGHTCGTACKPASPPVIYGPSPQCATGSVCYANGTCGAPLAANPNTIPGTICAVTCTGELTTVSAWNAFGQCTPSFNYPCAPYACNGSSGAGKTCGTSCTSASQCATGAVCNANGRCVMAGNNTCADAFTVLGADGTLVSCGTYRCHLGQCAAHCISSGECPAGYCCANLSGAYQQCVPTPSNANYCFP